MTQRVTEKRFRQRKLSTKQNLPILRENELEAAPLDDDATRHIPKVETGVEKGEEVEHHLQAVISAAQAAAQGGGKIAQLYIPTPDAVASKLQYEELYPRRFVQPTTYIRFSSTVEDTTGCPYCMTSDDVAFLKVYNQKRPRNAQCSEDEFEEVMYFFEETSHRKQPYASVDNTPVLSYEELEAEFDETISESARRFAKDIYSNHWKNQRLLKGNRPLIPSLKFETNIETDDSDPYVCFRRREVRQARKTRGRDAQVTEKLKRLRKELEEARYLMFQVKRREEMIRDQLALDKCIFEQRTALKEIKRKLSTKESDEELLINQKPAPKPKPRVDTQTIRVGPPGMASKLPITRPDGRIFDQDLVYFDDQLAKKAEVIETFVEDHVRKHQKWNEGYVDDTWRPMTPPLEHPVAKSDFRHVLVETQLITPPSSAEGGHAGAADSQEGAQQLAIQDNAARILVEAPRSDVPWLELPRFRLRIGRGGRMMMDRRGIKRPKCEPVDERVADRYRFAGDSSEDEEEYPTDWTDDLNTRYRMMIERSGDKQAQAQAQAQQYAQNMRAIENNHRSASGHLMPPTKAG